MNVKIEIDIDDAIKNLRLTEKIHLSKKMVKENLDISDIIEASKEAGYDENDILKEIDDDTIINYLSKQGYTILE